MPLVVAVLEAVGAEAHALADAAGPAAEGHEVGSPDEAAHGRVVELADCDEDEYRKLVHDHESFFEYFNDVKIDAGRLANLSNIQT